MLITGYSYCALMPLKLYAILHHFVARCYSMCSGGRSGSKVFGGSLSIFILLLPNKVESSHMQTFTRKAPIIFDLAKKLRSADSTNADRISSIHNINDGSKTAQTPSYGMVHYNMFQYNMFLYIV